MFVVDYKFELLDNWFLFVAVLPNIFALLIIEQLMSEVAECGVHLSMFIFFGTRWRF